MISCRDGFARLRNWKTFKTALWRIINPSGGPSAVRVAGVSERKRSLVLDFAGAEDSFNLKGAKFEELPPEDVPFADRDRFVCFLHISLADGTDLLLAEYLPSYGPDPVM